MANPFEDEYKAFSRDAPPEGTKHAEKQGRAEEQEIHTEGEGVSEADEDVEVKEDCQICSRYFLPLKQECLFMHAHEPWPKDVKLYQPYEMEQILLPDNANCLAVQTFLKMCELDFQIESKANAEAMSPSGKVPFIKCGAFVVSELEAIVQFVDLKGISLTTDLDKDQKADMRAYMSLIRNVLENAELYVCWCHNETYKQVTFPRNGSIYPFPLNYFKTWGKRNSELSKLKLLGWSGKDIHDVYKEVENCCQALTDRLEGQEYFFGSKYTEFDALLYGHLATLLLNPLPPRTFRLTMIARSFPPLVNYVRKINVNILGLDNDFDFDLTPSATSEDNLLTMKYTKTSDNSAIMSFESDEEGDTTDNEEEEDESQDESFEVLEGQQGHSRK